MSIFLLKTSSWINVGSDVGINVSHPKARSACVICFSILVDALADRINGSHQGKRRGAFLFASESHHGVLSDWGAEMEGSVNPPDDSTPEPEGSSYRRERSKALWTQSGCRYFNDVDSSWKQINRIRISVGFRAWPSFQSHVGEWSTSTFMSIFLFFSRPRHLLNLLALICIMVLVFWSHHLVHVKYSNW